MKKKLLALAALSSAAVSNVALAAQDYSGVSTALTAEITAAMPVVLTIAGMVLAIGLGLRLIKRAARS